MGRQWGGPTCRGFPYKRCHVEPCSESVSSPRGHAPAQMHTAATPSTAATDTCQPLTHHAGTWYTVPHSHTQPHTVTHHTCVTPLPSPTHTHMHPRHTHIRHSLRLLVRMTHPYHTCTAQDSHDHAPIHTLRRLAAHTHSHPATADSVLRQPASRTGERPHTSASYTDDWAVKV